MEGTIEEELEVSGAWFALRHPWWILIHKYYQHGFLDKFEALVCMKFHFIMEGKNYSTSPICLHFHKFKFKKMA